MTLDRKIKPQPNGRIKFNIPAIETFQLKNGLSIYFVQRNTLPIVQINLIVHSGSRFDLINKNGLSKLTSMLIDEGAGSLTGLEIDSKIESLGSVLSTDSSMEHSSISLMTLKNNIEKSLEIFSLILKEPTFKEEDFSREKEKLQTSILQLNDDASYLASTNFTNRLFDSTPYQFPGAGLKDTVTEITNNDINDFYKNNFSPKNSSLIIVGDLEENELHELTSKYFSDWNNLEKPEQLNLDFEKTKNQIILIDKPEAPQSELRIGHISKSRKAKDYFATNILNSILGGQFSSRINLNLREDKGYTYGAHSNFNYNSYGGSFSVSTSVKSENTGDAIKEILYELKNIRKSISQEELDFSKSYLTRRYPSMFETYSQLASNASLLPIYGLEQDYFQNYINNISKCTLDDVMEAAKENILLDELVTVIVGDRAKIKDQIKGFDSFEIISK
ncbi:MAG: insulinase family protein [Ignavibacteriae bacterium]|nr:insulinase family protein [Ignavibacteriota bacterium]